MRKLASIQTVSGTEAIPGADAIERIRVLGWWVVAKKGEFRPGDRVVFCEIDSLLPERAEFEFLRKGSFKPAVTDVDGEARRAGFRIRTVKLRGQISQGICFPLSILPAGAPQDDDADVTEHLEIIKYEPSVPAALRGRVRGGFPGFLPKTDETRIQVLLPLLERHRGRTFALTEKLDGTSFTAFLRDGEFGVCSRNLWMDDTDDGGLFVRLARKLELRTKLEAIRERFGFQPAIQGEVLGPGIQGNKYSLKAIELRLFNVLDIDAGRLADHDRVPGILDAAGLNGVPQLGTFVLNHTVDELVAMSIGISALNPAVQREGLVIRPLVEEHDQDVGGRLSFKVINPNFLLKYDE